MSAGNGAGNDGARRAEALSQSVWLTVTARAASIMGPLLVAIVGWVVVEMRADFKDQARENARTALETAVVLERVTTTQDALRRSDDKQDGQIENLWRQVRRGLGGDEPR